MYRGHRVHTTFYSGNSDRNVCRLAHLAVHYVHVVCECGCVSVCAALKMENPEAGKLCCHFTQNPCDSRAPSSSRRVLAHRFSTPSFVPMKRITFNLNGLEIIVNFDVHVISQQQVVHAAIRRSSARSSRYSQHMVPSPWLYVFQFFSKLTLWFSTNAGIAAANACNKRGFTTYSLLFLWSFNMMSHMQREQHHKVGHRRALKIIFARKQRKKEMKCNEMRKM